MTSILVIAGTDSSGGAGLTRDTATAAALGVAVKPAGTAVTGQTDAAGTGIHSVPPDTVAAQIDAAFVDAAPGAVKIGMLGTAEIASVVTERLARYDVPVVIDPVLKATSGAGLLAGEMLWPLLARAGLVTPHLDEAAVLSGLPVARSDDEIAAQARTLLQRGLRAVLIKGGHGDGDTARDHLFCGPLHDCLTAPRLPGAKRGTGCTLATAIACHLARGAALPEACRRGEVYLQGWRGSDTHR